MQMHIKQERQDLHVIHEPTYGQQPNSALQNGNPGMQGYPVGYPMHQRPPPPPQHIYHSGQPYGMPPNVYNNGQQPPNPLTALQAQVDGNKPPEPEPEKVKISENQIDIESVKGKFGWTTLDGINVPYIFRKDKKFVSVRIVEQKLLSRYPNSYPDELGKHQPLTSYFITDHEAKLLNEINIVHCGGEFGRRDFNSKDLIVLLTDFDDFYNLVKKTFPENNSKSPLPNQQSQSKIPNNVQVSEEFTSSEMCGWIQVNNTVTPFVKRELEKFVPLSVMKYAAGLSLPEQGLLPSDEECSLLNKSCELAGFNFNFSKTTKIISISDITRHCDVHITPLPSVNPLQHARYIDLPSSGSGQSQNPANQPNRDNQQQATSVHQRNMAKQQNSGEPAHINNNMSQNTQFFTRPPPPYDAYNGPVRPQFQGRAADAQNPSGQNRYQQNVHPAFVDPMRYMFSYNRYPYNMYRMQFGPPNVTVNPPQGGYGQMPMPPPAYPQNPQMNPNLPAGGRNPTPGLDNQKNRQSPARSSSVGSNGYPNQQPSPVSSQMSSMSPRYDPNSRQPVTTNQSQLSPQGRNTGYNFSMNSASTYQGMQQQPQAMLNGNVPPNFKQSTSQQQPAANWPLVSQSNNTPVHNLDSRNIPGGPHFGETVNLNASHTSPGRNIPPPPVMSGPHVPGQVFSNNTTMVSAENLQAHGNRKETVSPVRISTANQSRPTNGNVSNNSEKEQDSSLNAKNVPTLVGCIKGEWLVGKSISCMHLDNSQRTGKFCLVEAVCKLYFNGCSVNEFLFALENVLKIPLVTCTDEEEKAFIHYYSLPVTVLKCNKMINFEDLEKFFPQLSYVFREKTGTSEPHKTLSMTNTTTSPTKNTNQGTNNELSTSNLNLFGKNSSITHHPRKRPTISPGGPASKLPCKRLEETVQRLRQQTVGATEFQDAQLDDEPIKTNGAIIILDD